MLHIQIFVRSKDDDNNDDGDQEVKEDAETVDPDHVEKGSARRAALPYGSHGCRNGADQSQHP